MPIPLPVLDDRRWADLIEEGRGLIPLYAPEWTDHNVHDPGITLMELFAWIAEMDIYQVNRIPDRHRLKFLSLAGIEPRPPRAAQNVLAFRLQQGLSLSLPATTEFSAQGPQKTEVVFRTLRELTVLAATLETVQVESGGRFQDLTSSLRKNEPLPLFGDLPSAGASFYLGLKPAQGWVPPAGEILSLYFRFDSRASGARERDRLREEHHARARSCDLERPNPCRPDTAVSNPVAEEKPSIPPHHSARTVWEYPENVAGEVRWTPLEAEDDTRSLTLDGAVRLKIPPGVTKKQIGRVAAQLFYVRCRFAGGAYDAPVTARDVLVNAVAAEQTAPAGQKRRIAPGAVIEGVAPPAGSRTGVLLELNDQREIAKLRFTDSPDIPRFVLLEYLPLASPAPGSLTLEAVLLGIGNGAPFQTEQIPEFPLDQDSFELWTQEGEAWRRWEIRPDFDASAPADTHCKLDLADGQVTFGDGERGRVPPAGALIFARYRTTRGAEGDTLPKALRDSPHNRALMGDVPATADRLEAGGAAHSILLRQGEDAETIEHAIGRAIEMREAPLRAVTLEDYEKLTRETPGVRLARVKAWANLHPGFDCLKAPGVITVMIVPDMSAPRPTPSTGLLAAVADYLHRRRVLGTRVEVVGPRYRQVAVRGSVRALPAAGGDQLRKRIFEALDEFLNPLTGGPERTGWPFGRDVYRSEVLQVIDQIPGVDHVASLELIPDGCPPVCGNVCLRPGWLVTAGPHEIEVV